MIIDPVKAMLDSGYLVQEGLDGTPEYYAHLICDRGAMRIAELHRVLSRGHRSPAGIKASKKNVVRAMVKIAKDVVNGIFTLTDVSNSVDHMFFELEEEARQARRSRT